MADQRRGASRSKTGANGRKKKGTTRSGFDRVVDRSTETVEGFHRAIASWPLDALERVHRLEAPVGRVRKLQDRSITATYRLVRGVNREIAQFVGERSHDRSLRDARRAKKARAKSGVEPEVVARAS
jgi:hypothetical protein